MEERLKIEHQPDRQCTTTAIVGAREIDPVCGMRLDPATLKHYFDIAGRRFHFCSADCRAKFEADPNAYHKRKAATSHPAKAGVTYTCPMHPQIRMEGPGNCPICGMTLESLTASGAAAPNSEVADMTRRFWIALALTLPVFVLEMGSHIPGLGLNAIIPPFISSWVQFGLATPSSFGQDGRSFSAAGCHLSAATSTCLPSFHWVRVRPTSTVSQRPSFHPISPRPSGRYK
jgi:YHS domain-containing protein